MPKTTIANFAVGPAWQKHC